MKGPLWKRLPRSLLGGCFFVFYGLGSLAIGGLLFPPLALVGARRAIAQSLPFARRCASSAWMSLSMTACRSPSSTASRLYAL